ncbi:hypothetical protein DAI22_09g050600 [Oryza sativa Japonica Group]|nr:hypothetical protein DAI22_09g050600 [Oryza sativa Japonica Group]
MSVIQYCGDCWVTYTVIGTRTQKLIFMSISSLPGTNQTSIITNIYYSFLVDVYLPSISIRPYDLFLAQASSF